MVSAQNLPIFPSHSGGKATSFLQLPQMMSHGISLCPDSPVCPGADFLVVSKHTKVAMPVACALDETLVFTCVSAGHRHSLHFGLYSNDILAVRPLTLYIPYPTLLIFNFNVLTSV